MIERDTPSVVIRVRLFGEFQVERRSATGAWEPVSDWGKGLNAKQILKYLLSRGRIARRQDVVDALWEQSEPALAEDYLIKAVTKLRQALRSDRHSNLLQTVYNRTTYTLADQSRIWVDADACEEAIREAEQVGVTSTEGVRLLEQAAGWFEQGPFLAGEGGLWSHGWRGRMETVRHRCLLWLIDGYIQHKVWRKAEEIAEKLLRDDPLHEQAFTRLVHILQQQGMSAAVSRRYRDTKAFCQKQQLPFPSALDALAQNLHNKVSSEETHALLHPLPKGISPILAKNAIDSLLCLEPSTMISTNQQPDTPNWPTWFGERLGRAIIEIEMWNSGRDMACIEFQMVLKQEFNSMTQPGNDEAYTPARRQFLISLATLPLSTILNSNLHQQKIALDRLLPRFAASITACWELYFCGCSSEVETYLFQYLPYLTMVVSQSLGYEKMAANLASQAYQLEWIIALQRQDFGLAKASIEKALFFGRISGDSNICLSALIRKAHLYHHLKNPVEQLSVLEEADTYVNKVTPLLYSWFAVVKAEAHAHLKHTLEANRLLEAAYTSYPTHPEQDANFVYAPVGKFTIANHAVLSHLYLKEAGKALTVIHEVDETLPRTPVPRRVELTNRTLAAYCVMGELREACGLFDFAANFARQSGSKLRWNEVCGIYIDMVSRWPNELTVRDLEKSLIRKG